MWLTITFSIVLALTGLVACDFESEPVSSPAGGGGTDFGGDDFEDGDGDLREQIPRLKGEKLKVARRDARRSDFRVSVVRRKPSSKTPGIVLSQSPRPGALRPPGSTIRLTISKPKPEPEPPPPPPNGCHSSYQGACLDPNSPDYDCAGGTGDGPDYTGPVTIVGPDVYGLDGDGDGIGCE
jgi:hypothetical protein